MAKTERGWERRKRPVQGRSRATVGYVLESAAQLFSESGYEGTTTNQVAERAGVSIGSVYQYFPSKEALLVALAERHLEEAREESTAALRGLREEGLAPEEFFRAFIDFVVEFNRNQEPLHDVLYGEVTRSRRVMELVEEVNAACGVEVEVYLRERGLGGCDPPLKAEILANMAGRMVHELALDPPPGRNTAEYTEQIVAACLGYLWSS